MKTNNIFSRIVLIFILTTLFQSIFFKNISLAQSQWGTFSVPFNGVIVDVDFLNTDTGFVALANNATDTIAILRTMNKGITFDTIWKAKSVDAIRGFSIEGKDANTCLVSYDDFIYEIEDGFQAHCFTFPDINYKHKIRINESGTGYCLFSTIPPNVAHNFIYKTTNYGLNWTSIVDEHRGNTYPLTFEDIAIKEDSPNVFTMVGTIQNADGNHPKNRKGIYFSTTNGFQENTGAIEDSIGFNFVKYLPNGETRILATDGIYNQNRTKIYSLPEISPFTNQYGFKFINNNWGIAAVNDGRIIETTNGGYNWTTVSTINGNYYGRSAITSVGEIVYYGDAISNTVYVRKLSTYIYTFFDGQSSNSQLTFDGTDFNTPQTVYLRGGISSLTTSKILNQGQTNERIFYKWNDGFMYSGHGAGKSFGFDYYLAMSGTTIANYYKTRQLSNLTNSISNPSQTKSIRDTTINNITATHTIHESMGGIFYSKSTNFGATYQTEEVVNLSDTTGAADGNKNAYLTVMRSYGGQYPITISDVDRNVAVVWEKYNSTTQMVEIKFAHRVLNIPQTGYEWKTYRDNSGNEYLTSFAASSGFESKPKCFVAVSPGQTQDGPFLIIVPHLRPNGSQNKIFTSVRYNSQSQDYELENGFIQDLAVTGPFNYYSSYIVHFAYLKDDKVAYRREEFGYYNGNIYRGTSPLPEVNNNISSGDGGFTSRYTPDISLMGGVPVITYAASYDAWRTIQYEDQSTGSIQVNRHPIVKVQKTPTGWSQFVIYNSGNNQSKPDIEGSTSTLSYILNYSIGNGSFKKIVNIPGYPGSMCQPNIFSGTDSRLINNSYTGSFGSNLSLLTLSPQSGLYKLDKQNFVITNITAQDSYDIDNLDGVVDLDTVSYSFKVGPIYTQSFFEYYYEVDGVGVIGPSLEDQVIGGIEFNENLKSYPFLLNESQALLIGSNASYVKDNSYYSISEIPYTVKLYNKTTGLLHRTLFQDTIKDKDSVETESLRGFYITDIPNGADSFYVKLEVDNEFDNADYYINPIYEDENEEQDNMNEKKMAVIFENTTPQIHDNNIPAKNDLLQNYPNPFNPTTNLEFGISKLGFVSLKVYDILGKEVKTLVNEIKPAGTYNIVFDGSSLSSGVYFYRIEAGEFRDIRRMVLIK